MGFYPPIETLVHPCRLFQKYSGIFLSSGHMRLNKVKLFFKFWAAFFSSFRRTLTYFSIILYGESWPDGADAWNTPAPLFWCGGEMPLLQVHLGYLTSSMDTGLVTKVRTDSLDPSKIQKACNHHVSLHFLFLSCVDDCTRLTGMYAVCLKIHLCSL